jgi:hypothetical protein
MPAHSASKTRVNALMSLASTPWKPCSIKDVDGRDKPGHDVEGASIPIRAGITPIGYCLLPEPNSELKKPFGRSTVGFSASSSQ